MSKRVYPASVCRYCGEEEPVNRLPAHEKKCPDNPEVAGALVGFMLDNRTRGGALTAPDYAKATKGEDLPSEWTIRKHFGGWPNFVRWCGMSRPEREPTYIPGLDDPDPPSVVEMRRMEREELSRERGMPARSALRCIREWHPKKHRYVPVGWQRVAEIR